MTPIGLASRAVAFTIIGLGMLSCAANTVTVDDQPIILILAGQSNMVGHGRTRDIADRGIASPPNVRFFSGQEEASLTGRSSFGPELTLAAECARGVPDREVIVVKYAIGATSLLDWAPDWNEDRARITGNAHRGALYAKLMAIIDELPLGDARVAGVLWMQGERDARIEAAGAGYYENIGKLIDAFRKDLNRPDLPFLIGQVDPPPERYPARDIVRLAQQRAADELPNVYLVETDDLSKWDDGLHYDSEGLLELGRRFARTLIAAGSCR